VLSAKIKIFIFLFVLFTVIPISFTVNVLNVIISAAEGLINILITAGEWMINGLLALITAPINFIVEQINKSLKFIGVSIPKLEIEKISIDRIKLARVTAENIGFKENFSPLMIAFAQVLQNENLVIALGYIGGALLVITVLYLVFFRL